MNKKANTYGFWVEIIVFIVLFLGIVAIMGFDMNEKYNKTYDTTLGLNISSSLSSLQDYQTDIVNDTNHGQAELSDFGVIRLITIPSMIIKVTGIIWSFASGNFIVAVVHNMQLGGYELIVASIFRTLYVIAIGFILIKLILRINI